MIRRDCVDLNGALSIEVDNWNGEAGILSYCLDSFLDNLVRLKKALEAAVSVQ
jgi:hypothetical protein